MEQTKKPIAKKPVEKKAEVVKTPVVQAAPTTVKSIAAKKMTDKRIAEKKSQQGLLILIRIKGDVKVKPQIRETLFRLRLRRKYAAVLVNGTKKETMNMVDKVKHSIAFGLIEKETLIKLIEVRGKSIDGKKVNAASVAEGLLSGKKLEDFNLKPFFRLHPPRKGIDSKIQFNNGGVLGNNRQEINKLVERML